jgi:hypothetical protein
MTKYYKSPKGINETPEEDIKKPEPVSHIPLYGQENFPVGTSPHSVPTLHSSKFLSRALDKINEKIERDDFSVSTIETTSTVRFKAAQRAVNTSAKTTVYNYAELTPIDDIEISKRAPKKINIPKQVDKAWLERKQNHGPSPEDLKILYTPDPIVNIKLAHNYNLNSEKRQAMLEASGWFIFKLFHI